MEFKPSTDELLEIAAKFCPANLIIQINQIGSGRINHTFLVRIKEDHQFNTFILQKINTYIFKNPDVLIENISELGKHLDSKPFYSSKCIFSGRWETIKIIPTLLSGDYSIEFHGGIWRAITYINNSRTFDVVQDNNHAREIGLGLGIFHSLTYDMSSQKIVSSIDNFHSILNYLLEYDNCLSSFNISSFDLNRYEQRLEWMFNFIDKYRKSVELMEKTIPKKGLRRSLIHGDPKINNFMFDLNTNHVVGIIDLDTLHSNYLLYDIGDCFRSCCNPLGEDSSSPIDVRFDLTLFESALSGYTSIAKHCLGEIDYMFMPYFIGSLSFELGLRFLIDFFFGDLYFKAEYSLQNFFRAETQLRLTHSIVQQETFIIKTISQLSL